MKYKSYTGVVEFDEESSTLFGHVIGLRDGITFQGDSVAEVIQAFHDSVDDYLEFSRSAARPRRNLTPGISSFALIRNSTASCPMPRRSKARVSIP